MDAFFLHRDSNRRGHPFGSASAGYGGLPYPFRPQYLPPRLSLPYSLHPWTSLPLPSTNPVPFSSFYAPGLDRPTLLLRSRLDARDPLPTEPVFARGFASTAFTVPTPRRREDAGRLKSTPLGSQSLRPRIKSFKQTGGGRAVDKMVQGRKKAVDVYSKQSRVKASIEALAEEARELHALWRTGVDHTPSKLSWNSVANKRKTEAPKSEQGKSAKNDGKPDRENSKASRRRRNRNLRQLKKKMEITQADGEPSESLANAELTPERKEWPLSGEPARDVDSGSGWGGSIEKVKVDDPPMTEGEEPREILVDLQREACDSVSEFLGNFSEGEESESEFSSESEEEADEDQKPGALTVKGREEKAFQFFSKLLLENQELRKLYVERCNSGKFECLVCSSIGGKMVKRFGDLVSLVMHASKILKTKRRPEHRGYGRAVCGVLGWDPLRTPTLSKGINIRPRGCIPSADEPTDMAIVKKNGGLEHISQDGKNSVDVIGAKFVDLAEESIKHLDFGSDD